MDRKTAMMEELRTCAIREFMEKGFHKASLREICNNAGFTTGFLYNHFKSKNGLFSWLVDDVATDIYHKIDIIFDKYIDNNSEFSPVYKEIDIARYLYYHRDVLLLLFTRAEGTDYEKYADKIYEKYEEEFIRFYSECLSSTEDHTFLCVICSMRYRSYYEILRRASSMEEAVELARKVGYFKSAGLMGMAKYYRSITDE